ncbi:serine/threonine protein kinase [Haloferula sargassicola]|uniref:Serine/threonine-protein kinase PknD n=1 Tax=Haloferula sargassicola TaxID=490096 RepID=A0ABP9UIT0_9BACT
MNDEDRRDEVDHAILEVALSIDDPVALEQFLDHCLGHDPGARRAMAELVVASRESMQFFLEADEERGELAVEWCEGRDTPGRARGGNEQPGDEVGGYRLISRLGEGSSGVIYEAEQSVPIRRRVALKILRAGMDTETMIARFESERQTLALMDHPNIARVIDAGATASGRPFFVMELVAGERITDYCDRNRLGIPERLELFTQVCEAIEHAHQKGIIHRDIKPSNVLVGTDGGRPHPKVIDFGIAKMADPAGSRRKVITFHGQLFGTPAYMSPEQIDLAGLDTDTRSDIYSLGILLYELLVGRTPHAADELAGLGVSAIRERILHQEIAPPSKICAKMEPARLEQVAAARNREPRQLIAAVAGDLGGIVMKATERQRSRRYQTVHGLMLDIGRFLRHQPVTARPPSRTYLLRKFVRRNRAACAVGLLLAVLLVTGFAVTAALYKRERMALDEQSRLKVEAEHARNEESRLRRQADARSNLARVAFLLDQDRVAEADDLRQRYPLSSIEPSLEAATVFRALGDWNAAHDRWDQALQCFLLLIQANRLEQPIRILEGSDLMACGLGLLHCNHPDYYKFRSEIVDRYAPATTQYGAEHFLKVCCAVPAEPEMMAKLAESAEVLGDPRTTPYPCWSSLSLALYHLRAGNFDESAKFCAIGLNCTDAKTSCLTSLRATLALALQKAGKTAEAAAELDEAKRIEVGCAGNDFVNGRPADSAWFDWALARHLIREASGDQGSEASTR